MNDEIKEIELDHFNNINELKQTVETWIKEDDMYWNRWFSLYDLKTLLDYITNLQQEINKLTAESTEWESKYYDLQQENEDLKQTLHNITINVVEEENTTVLDLIKENERLNNIINELEKYIDDNYFYDDVGMKIFDVSLLEDKLKELKEIDDK